MTLLSRDAPRAASDEQTARISTATRWRVAARTLVICPLSAARALLTGPASANRDASNGPRTTDQGHRPARAGAMRATDQGQRTEDTGPPGPARCQQRTTDNEPMTTENRNPKTEIRKMAPCRAAGGWKRPEPTDVSPGRLAGCDPEPSAHSTAKWRFYPHKSAIFRHFWPLL
jgi:hypothetical protein